MKRLLFLELYKHDLTHSSHTLAVVVASKQNASQLSMRLMPIFLVFVHLESFYGIITCAGIMLFEAASSLNKQQVNLVPFYGIAQ